MRSSNGIVFELDPDAAAALAERLGDRRGVPLVAGGCCLEVVVDALQPSCSLQAIVTWHLAVPFKVERLSRALAAAGGVRRDDLDAAGVRCRALAAHHPVLDLASRAGMVALGRAAGGRDAGGGAPHHLLHAA